jgi:hypothetical protein
MQDLIDMTGFDDSGTSPEPATWTCCACTYHNQQSYLMCELEACSTERAAPAAADFAVQDEDEAEERWECSSCTFSNEPLLLCCEICNSSRSSLKLEAAAAQSSKAAQPATAAQSTNATKSQKRPASSTSAAPAARKCLKATSSTSAAAAARPGPVSKPAVAAVQHRETGTAAAAPAQSENYCSRCSGYFMSAHALITHECAASCERIGKPDQPIVLANFITAVEEVALLRALEVNNAALRPHELGPWRRASSFLTSIYDSNVRSAAVSGASAFPDTVVSTVFERMRQVPELRHWRPDSVGIPRSCLFRLWLSLAVRSAAYLCLMSLHQTTQ